MMMITFDKKIHRWIMLALVWVGVFMTTYAQNQLSALSTTLMDIFSLTPAQYSSVYAAPNWVAVFLGLFVGLASDKIGVRKMITVAGAICVIGMVFRVFSESYVPLFITSLLSGFVAMVVSTNRAKILGAWFSREEMGLAMGICVTVSPVATTIGLGTTALLPSVKVAFILCAVVSIVFFIGWVLLGKDRPDDVELPPSQPVLTYLKSVAKNPWVWVLGFTGFVLMGCQITTVAFISAAIQSRGFTAAIAGVLSTGISISMGVGCVVTPLIVKKTGRYKPIIGIYTVIGAVCIYFGWKMSSIAALYAVLFGAGFVLGSLLPLLFIFPIFLVGQERVSSAAGLICSIQLIGAATCLTYIIIPITGMNFGKLYGAAAICLVISGIMLLLIPELGRKGKYQITV
jgi:NNP family nitrate/nitrite transporter-like MFS transporter